MDDFSQDPDPAPVGPGSPVPDLAALDAFWQWVAGSDGFAVPQLFGLFLDADGIALPTLINVKEEYGLPPLRIDAVHVDHLMRALEMVLDSHAPGGSVALMWARPGRGPSGADDREALRCLHDGLAAAAFDAWPLFFATDDSVGIVPPDVLAA